MDPTSSRSNHVNGDRIGAMVAFQHIYSLAEHLVFRCSGEPGISFPSVTVRDLMMSYSTVIRSHTSPNGNKEKINLCQAISVTLCGDGITL